MDAQTRKRSLEYLCQAYWYPLYAYVRRRGHGQHDAEDLTQAFFARFLEKQDIEVADPAKGKFRAFLLVCMKHFLANEWDKSKAEKRGGKVQVVSFDAALAESRYDAEPYRETQADEIYDRSWATTLMERALENLETEFRRKGKSTQWRHWRTALSTDENVDLSAMGEALNMTPNAVKTAVHRLRQRYREALRAQIADTVDEADLDEEMRYLLSVIAHS